MSDMRARQILDDLAMGRSDEPAPGEDPLEWAHQQAKQASGGKAISVGDIMAMLPDDYTDKIIELMNTVPDEGELARLFKELLRPYQTAMASIGLDPDFTAYMLVYARRQAQGLA